MTTTTKETPVLFNAPMVRALIEGRKTQTRRIIKPQPPEGAAKCGPNSYEGPGGPTWWWTNDDETKLWPRPKLDKAIACPFGKPGDRLWVRETWQTDPVGEFGECYKATGHNPKCAIHGHLWRPSIHMPRWASRLTLEIVAVRVERLQEISENDAIAEGAWRSRNPALVSIWPPEFENLWESINGPGSWEANPWVWVISFRKVEP